MWRNHEQFVNILFSVFAAGNRLFYTTENRMEVGQIVFVPTIDQFIKVNFKVEIERSLFVLHSCFSNEIEATLNRLKKLEKDLTVKEKELREV